MHAKELLELLERNRDFIDEQTEILVAPASPRRRTGTNLYFTSNVRFDYTFNTLTVFVDEEVPSKDASRYFA